MPSSYFAANVAWCNRLAGFGGLCLSLVLAGVGCATSGGGAAEGKTSPPTAGVTKNQAWRDAEAVASLDPERLTVMGGGASMRPVYGENTVLVLQKIPFDTLVAGMDVAYRDQRGVVVLHRLLARDSRGWRARGLNNAEEDQDRVTPANFIGIVYASFANAAVE
jgi:hypothetical protein